MLAITLVCKIIITLIKMIIITLLFPKICKVQIILVKALERIVKYVIFSNGRIFNHYLFAKQLTNSSMD